MTGRFAAGPAGRRGWNWAGVRVIGAPRDDFFEGPVNKKQGRESLFVS